MTHEKHFARIECQNDVECAASEIHAEIDASIDASIILQNIEQWRDEQQARINYHADKVIARIRGGIRPTGLRHRPFERLRRD